ncbi:hypothetical protein NUW54_g10425 [Trametes sanguinea]|uniref:Uncharacterized protein n=1 Tax=Trametes sanguinea TaxID=158606 RepID=A0ACC1NZ82_9APHY|nr:hypothetical protein NUW54_g10425 [Trametes sanguinea]
MISICTCGLTASLNATSNALEARRCTRARQAEAALTEARKEFQAAASAAPPSGTSPPTASALTLDTAPARTRRQSL